MADDAIIVGAEDNASRVLESVEKQIGRLTDGVQAMAEETRSASLAIVARFDAIAVAGAVVAAGWGALKIAQDLYASSRAALDAFNAQQESIDGLRHSLARYVDDVDAALAKQLELAASLQDFAGIGDESTLALQRQAAQMGYSEDQIRSLIATAAGLKGEFGIGYEQAFNLAVQATERNSSALSDLIPEMRLAYTEAQRFEMVQRASARGMEALADDGVWRLLERTQPAPYLPKKDPDAKFSVWCYRVTGDAHDDPEDGFEEAVEEAFEPEPEEEPGVSWWKVGAGVAATAIVGAVVYRIVRR